MKNNNVEPDYSLYFYVTQFRKIFNKILIVYILMALCLSYLFFKLTNVKEPVYYASSESGRLKILQTYSQSQIEAFKERLQQNKN